MIEIVAPPELYVRYHEPHNAGNTEECIYRNTRRDGRGTKTNHIRTKYKREEEYPMCNLSCFLDHNQYKLFLYITIGIG